MTLQEFFDACTNNPEIIGFYFVALPLTAFLASVFGKGEGHLSPWKYLYTVLVYAATIPGIFAIVLNVYLFLFERQPIMQSNLFTQVLPVMVMVLTLWLIKRNVPFEYIPGFNKISGLIMVMMAIIAVMWLLDRTRTVSYTHLRAHETVLDLVCRLLLEK